MSVLIVTPELSLAEKVRALFLRQNSPLSGKSHEAIEGYETSLVALQKQESYEVIIIVSDNYTEELADFIDHVERQKKGPILMMTDSDDVRVRARSRKLRFILPRTSVDQDVFVSVLDALKEYHQLGQSVHQLEEVYRLSEQRFKDVADHFADWLWEVDKGMRVVFSSSRRRSMENVEHGTAFSKCFLPEEESRLLDNFSQLYKEPKPFQDEEYWSFDAYGSRQCWSLSGVPIFDKKGFIIGYRGVAKDISNEKASVDHLYFLSNNDALTGFYNRNRFVEELGRVSRSHIREGLDGAVLVLNLDRFKFVNDTYGYEVGDKLIVHAGQIIKSMVRSEDFVARVGADEFAIIMPNTTVESAEKIGKDYLRAISARDFTFGSGSIRCTARIGGVSLGLYGSTSDELLSRAHTALAEAKNRGSNTLCMYDSLELRQGDIAKRMELLNFVSNCLDQEQERVILYYQPIVSLNNVEKVEHYEVLVRLLDQNNDIVSPVKFIEIAEEYGLIAKLDRIVACRALDMLERWQEQGKDISLSINISGKTFADKDVIERITQHLSTKNLKQGSAIFELTETSALKDITRARRVIAGLKEHGALLALDDCGVGYSSLDYIRQLDLDFIKIDGSFIRDLHRNKEDEAFVRALRDVARKLQIQTVAEMVEDSETVGFLKRIGIDFAQGYHFAMPAAELPEEFDEICKKALN